VLLFALDVANPAAMVATHNLTRQAEVPVDAGYLDDLGDDAVPAIVDLLDGLPPAEADAVRAELGCPPDADDGLAGWNLAHARADDAREALCSA
jgi:hypothetical protein